MKAKTKRTVGTLATAGAVVAAMGIFATTDIVGAMKAQETASPTPSASRVASTLKPLDVATAKPTPTPSAKVTAPSIKVTPLPTVQPQANPANIANPVPTAEPVQPVQTPAKPYVPCSAVGLVSDSQGVCHAASEDAPVAAQVPATVSVPVPVPVKLPVSATGKTVSAPSTSTSTPTPSAPATCTDTRPGMCDMAGAPGGAIPPQACPEGETWNATLEECGHLWVDPNPGTTAQPTNNGKHLGEVRNADKGNGQREGQE